MLSLCHLKKSKPMKATSHTSINSTVEYHVSTINVINWLHFWQFYNQWFLNRHENLNIEILFLQYDAIYFSFVQY